MKLLITAIILSSLSLTAFAKEINLYDQPKSDAKTIAKADSNTGVILIYTPKGIDWIKVADPRNGNVGWIKSSDLTNTNLFQSTLSFSQSVVSDNREPTTYHIIQFGQPQNITTEQTQAVMKQMHARQEAFQKSMQDMMRDMNKFFSDQNFPLLMPVVILPVQKISEGPKKSINSRLHN